MGGDNNTFNGGGLFNVMDEIDENNDIHGMENLAVLSANAVIVANLLNGLWLPHAGALAGDAADEDWIAEVGEMDIGANDELGGDFVVGGELFGPMNDINDEMDIDDIDDLNAMADGEV